MDLSRLKDLSSIEDVISDFTEVSHKGPSVLARCIFHDDSKPSLRIWEKNQRWRCFVCNIGGDVLDFIQRANNCSVADAAKYLESKYGLANNKPAKKVHLPGRKEKEIIAAAKQKLNEIDFYLWDRKAKIFQKEDPTDEDWKWLSDTEYYRSRDQDITSGLYELNYLSSISFKKAVEELNGETKPDWLALSESGLAMDAHVYYRQSLIENSINVIKRNPRLYILAAKECKEKDVNVLAIRLHADKKLFEKVMVQLFNG